MENENCAGDRNSWLSAIVDIVLRAVDAVVSFISGSARNLADALQVAPGQHHMQLLSPGLPGLMRQARMSTGGTAYFLTGLASRCTERLLGNGVQPQPLANVDDGEAEASNAALVAIARPRRLRRPAPPPGLVSYALRELQQGSTPATRAAAAAIARAAVAAAAAAASVVHGEDEIVLDEGRKSVDSTKELFIHTTEPTSDSSDSEMADDSNKPNIGAPDNQVQTPSVQPAPAPVPAPAPDSIPGSAPAPSPPTGPIPYTATAPPAPSKGTNSGQTCSGESCSNNACTATTCGTPSPEPQQPGQNDNPCICSDAEATEAHPTPRQEM